MDWYEDDEMVRQWEEISKEEEKIAKREDGRKEGTCCMCAEGTRVSSFSSVNKRKRAKEGEE